MREGVTKSGFKFVYDENRLDDMRMVDIVAVVMDEEAAPYAKLRASSQLVGKLLGEEAKEQLYKHIGESHEGRVPYAALSAEINDIMLGSTETKN